MIQFDLDMLDGDLLLSRGDLAFARGADEVRQRVLLRLRRVAGEWAYNITLGLPWIQQILVKNPNLALIRALFVREIAATRGVLAVRTLELTLDAQRRLNIEWEIVVDNGEGREFVADSAAIVFDNGTLQFLLEPIGQI